MKYLRIFMFIFFAVAWYASIECLRDSERLSEHFGAWISVFTCAIGCFVATINLDK